MKLLKVIREKEVTGKSQKRDVVRYFLRKAARAVIFDKDKKVALMYVTKNHYYKLPGGGVEEGESVRKALKRECLEEVGCKILIIKEVGHITEYRDQIKQRQESHCFLAKVVGKKGQSHFTKEESGRDFKILWVLPQKAIKLIKQSKPNEYTGKFIIKRDLIFLQEAIRLIAKEK